MNAPNTPTANVLSRLHRVQPAGNGWTAQCPAHDDRKNSLSVNNADNGGVVLRCHAGCKNPDICAKLGITLSDLFAEAREKSLTARNPSRRQIVKSYDYRDETGELLFQTVRFEPKDFSQRRPDGNGGWIWNLQGLRRILYRLPELIASTPETLVWFTEGEKDADRLAALELTATTVPLGAGKWRDEYSVHIGCRPVAILPDNDKPGRDHAETVAASCARHGSEARVVALSDLPAKGDVSDWFEQGGTIEQLLALYEEAPVWIDSSDSNASSFGGYQPLSIRDLRALELPKLEYVVDGLLPLGSATLLSAREKAGKGLLAIDLCVSVASEEPFLDRSVVAGPTIYCAAEENIREVRSRIEARIGSRAEPPVYVLRLDGSTDDRLDLADPELVSKLDAMIEGYSPLIVVLDTLREIHHGREDHSDDMAPLLKPLRQMAHRRNVALVVNHHMNRSGTFRGSTAIAAAFDQVIELSRDDDGSDQKPRATLKLSGRFGPAQRLTVVLGDSLHWLPTDPRVTVEAQSLRERIVSALRDAERGLTADEITEALHKQTADLKLKTVQNALALVKKEPVPPLVMTGRGVKNDPTRYWFPQPGLFPPSDSPIGREERGNHSDADMTGYSHWSVDDSGNNSEEFEVVDV